MIFEDQSRRRWKATVTLLATLLLVALVSVTFTVAADLKYPEVSTPQALDALTAPTGAPAKRVPDDRLPAYDKQSFVRSAFVMQQDDASVASLKQHINELDVVFPDWFTFTGQTSNVITDIDQSLLDFLKVSGVDIVPSVANLEAEGWTGQAFSTYLGSQANRTALSQQLLRLLQENGLRAINLDFEALDSAAMGNYLAFLHELCQLFHQNNLQVTVDVPLGDDAFDYRAIGAVVDQVVVMAYDEHYETGDPGPIASSGWFTTNVKTILAEVPVQKIVVALGQYAYDWNTTKGTGTSREFGEAIDVAESRNAFIQTEDDSVNSTFAYTDFSGDQHQVWMLDAVSYWNQTKFLADHGLYGVALWRTGSEDPTIWDFFAQRKLSGVQPSVLERARALNASSYEGNGEFLTVQSSPRDGRREIAADKGVISYAVYRSLPKGYDVKRFGHVDAPKVSLTFDDGPDPTYTDQILQVLRDHDVKATFFIVGEQARRWPDVLDRVARDGHEVGSHTYFHAANSQVGDQRFAIELDATQRMIRATTHRSSTLFRSPFVVDSAPTSPEVVHPLSVASAMGYTVVNADIDSDDYDNPGVTHIVATVLNELKSTGSNIVLFHDGGGDRSQTVAALRVLIPELKARGYDLVTPTQLLGVPQQSTQPQPAPVDLVMSYNDRLWISLGIWLHDWAWDIVSWLFLATLVFGIFRISLLGVLVLRSRRGAHEPRPDFQPFVSVVIPACNEEKVIARTLSAVLRSDYPAFEVVVVDDGSQDRTRAIVEGLAQEYPQLRVKSKPNGGKFTALNLALTVARAEHVVSIDADTIILPDTLTHLVAPFADASVDAVCGNIKVGNVRNLLTRFQAVEYITAQNYDRRAFDAANCISVVPGATGAWKKSSVLSVGGYSGQTLTEDADLTLTLLAGGGKVVYAPAAVSHTEAPETVKDLFKQRFRWSYGIYQCLWKHKGSFFKGTLGWLALPNMLIFQLLWPVLAPIGDAVLVYALINGNMPAIVYGYLTFLVMDLVASTIAFTLDGARYRDLWPLLIQRFYYRQFMYVVTFKALVAAVRGLRHTWNKVERRSSVQDPSSAAGLPQSQPAFPGDDDARSRQATGRVRVTR